jgi:hypothetical protein
MNPHCPFCAVRTYNEILSPDEEEESIESSSW